MRAEKTNLIGKTGIYFGNYQLVTFIFSMWSTFAHIK